MPLSPATNLTNPDASSDSIPRDAVLLPLEKLRALRNAAGLTGEGVVLALIDTGVDASHPLLNLAHSESVCDEDVSRYGLHATHSAGLMAGRDDTISLAPCARLINIKALRANQQGRAVDVARAFDAARAHRPQVIVVGAGFNLLPKHMPGGHGWQCRSSECILCRAVARIVHEDGVVVVAPSGNHHQDPSASHALQGLDSSSELCCPGRCDGAITVGAWDHARGLPAGFSSRGTSTTARAKPEFYAPGVDIESTMSCVAGSDVASTHPTAARSGTSTAAAVVGGVIALCIQARLRAGRSWDADRMKHDLTAWTMGCA